MLQNSDSFQACFCETWSFITTNPLFMEWKWCDLSVRGKSHVRENLCWCGEGGKSWLWGSGKETVSLILFLRGHRANLNLPDPVPPLAVSQHLLGEGTLVWTKSVNWTWQERVMQAHRESSEDQEVCVCTADSTLDRSPDTCDVCLHNLRAVWLWVVLPELHLCVVV